MEWGRGVWDGTRRKAAVAAQAPMEEGFVDEGERRDGGEEEGGPAWSGGGIEREDDRDRV